jgi:hypothetical protein
MMGIERTPETQAELDRLYAEGKLLTTQQLIEVAAEMGTVLIERRVSQIAAAAAVGVLIEGIFWQIEPAELRVHFASYLIEALQRSVREGLS